MKFKAFKMDGLGNDFLIIDNRNQKISLNPEQILKLSNREKGIGFDQLIYIENSTQADAEIKYFNSDGQMADACGNGNRCISDILIKEKNRDNVTFKVNNFVHTGSKNIDNLINVIMPKPKIKLSEIRNSTKDRSTNATDVEQRHDRVAHISLSKLLGKRTR